MAKFITANGPCRIIFFCPKNYSFKFVLDRIQNWDLKNTVISNMGKQNGQVYLEVEFPNIKTASKMNQTVREYFECISQPITQSTTV